MEASLFAIFVYGSDVTLFVVLSIIFLVAVPALFLLWWRVEVDSPSGDPNFWEREQPWWVIALVAAVPLALLTWLGIAKNLWVPLEVVGAAAVAIGGFLQMCSHGSVSQSVLPIASGKGQGVTAGHRAGEKAQRGAFKLERGGVIGAGFIGMGGVLVAVSVAGSTF